MASIHAPTRSAITQTDPLMDANEIAAYLHVSRRWVQKQAASRYPPFHMFRVANKIMARHSAVAAYLAQCEA
jgi:hypothetical protein